MVVTAKAARAATRQGEEGARSETSERGGPDSRGLGIHDARPGALSPLSALNMAGKFTVDTVSAKLIFL
jgi:hypothetical protein